MDHETFLRQFGERLRRERARRGMSRRLLAGHAGISERYITQIEAGKGNVSILILRQIAHALGLPLTRLLEHEGAEPEGALVRGLLARLNPAELGEAYALLSKAFGGDPGHSRSGRIALIGLRGAGKSSVGRRLAERLEVPFFELDREIERLAGTPLGELIELYGQQAYRRYELRALQELLEGPPRFVVATGGGLVSEPATYETLLRHCVTVWVRAEPEEHMARVVAQGDLRPMAGHAQAMEDLRRILAERTPLYARADHTLSTSQRSPEESVDEIVGQMRF